MKNETNNLLIRKVKQLNLVINGFMKEKTDREKEIQAIKKKYDFKLDSIFKTYNTKMTRMLKSFYGQQKYFIDVFQPEFQITVDKYRHQINATFSHFTNCYDSYQAQLYILSKSANDLSRTVFKMIMVEDAKFEQIYFNMINIINKLNQNHLTKMKDIDKNCEFMIATTKKNHQNQIFGLTDIKKSSNNISFKSINCTQLKNMHARIRFLKQTINILKKDFLKLINQHQNSMKSKKRDVLSIIDQCHETKKSKIRAQSRLKSRISDFETVYQSISTEPKRQKSRHEIYVKNLSSSSSFNGINSSNNRQIKTVLSAGSILEWKLLFEDEIKDMKYSLTDLRSSNQRELFELRFQFRDEKNELLRDYSELTSIINDRIDLDKLENGFNEEFQKSKQKKKIELENLQKKFDDEYNQAKEKIKDRENMKNKIKEEIMNSKNKYNEVLEKYEKEFHELCNQLSESENSSTKRKEILRNELINSWKEAIDFENQRHSMQMLLFDIHKSSRIVITNATSNYTNTIQLLKQSILRQMEINEQALKNCHNDINQTNSDISLNSNMNDNISSSMSGSDVRTSQMRRCREVDYARAELLTRYGKQIDELKNRKEKMKEEIQTHKDRFNDALKSLNSKYSTFCESYKEMTKTQLENRESNLDEIKKKYDSQISKLNDKIAQLKKTKPSASEANAEVQIGKMNWHCELLNSQLATLTRQLMNAQRSPKKELKIKIPRQIKSSLSTASPIHVPM
ncbi:hypothetical protein TRFO_03215 [Tritrichomonas foetus]|uniref:Uncharacterized protein n=1 Tax=Tritrichomonas foetus TaxID=1144522 RepID=A0A1J4KTE7_9EUKA|nr:hypothetical protein TRFO_03215 [Tritrichomonas foetus]|eukprot:OHT14160.1 hypothetical protein TRFO_03215 [Tritrichomonas foetus]